MDIGFALNYQHVVEVDTTPNGDLRDFARRLYMDY